MRVLPGALRVVFRRRFLRLAERLSTGERCSSAFRAAASSGKSSGYLTIDAERTMLLCRVQLVHSP